MEFILTHNQAFVTNNYYVENGYIERRIRPIKAASYYSDVTQNLSQASRLGYKHKKVLKNMYLLLKDENTS